MPVSAPCPLLQATIHCLDYGSSSVQPLVERSLLNHSSCHSENKDLPQLSSLGHFLKGSSATLGLAKVRDSCEKIQHYGAKMNEDGSREEPDEEMCLSKCRGLIAQAKTEFKEVEALLKKFYHDEGTA